MNIAQYFFFALLLTDLFCLFVCLIMNIAQLFFVVVIVVFGGCCGGDIKMNEWKIFFFLLIWKPWFFYLFHTSMSIYGVTYPTGVQLDQRNWLSRILKFEYVLLLLSLLLYVVMVVDGCIFLIINDSIIVNCIDHFDSLWMQNTFFFYFEEKFPYFFIHYPLLSLMAINITCKSCVFVIDIWNFMIMITCVIIIIFLKW